MKLQPLILILLLLIGLMVTSCVSINQPANNEIGVATLPVPTQVSPTLVATSTSEPTPKATLTLPAPVEDFISTDYGLAKYGLTFSYPKTWELSDIGDALVLADRSSPLATIFFETGSVTNFDNADPVEILNGYYPSIALGMLKGEHHVLKMPSALDVNGQKAGIMSVEAVPTVGTDAAKVVALAGMVVNEERFVLVQGVILPDETDKFIPIFEEVLSSIKLDIPAGAPIILPGTVYRETKVDLARPNFYRFTATDNNPLAIIAKAEAGILAPLLVRVYRYNEKIYLQELMPDKKDLLAESKGNNKTDLAALVFEPKQDEDYLIGIGTTMPSHGDFLVYVMDTIRDDLLSEAGNLTAGESKELEFSGNAGETYLVTVMPTSNVEIRYEISDAEGKRLDVVDYRLEGEPEASIFIPKVESNYILRILSRGETNYRAFVGKIGSTFSD